MLVEYQDELNKIGLNFETIVASQASITKKKVVQCLRQIHQPHLADILSARQGESAIQLHGAEALAHPPSPETSHQTCMYM